MLSELLKLTAKGPGSFTTNTHQMNFQQTLFGGQVLGQALVAAMHTVEQRLPHSLHGYFLRAGTTAKPINYEVTRVRDGRSVSNRRVIAVQDDKPIFEMMCSFHIQEAGFHHQLAQPNKPSPSKAILEDNEGTAFPVPEFKGLEPINYVTLDQSLFSLKAVASAETEFWVKSKTPLSSTFEHYGALAFTSDIGLLASTLLPHDTSLFSSEVMPASMDHAMWFHQVPNFNQWLQYTVQSPWANHARGLGLGHMYTTDNQLLATISQEGLIRPIPKPTQKP